MEAEAERVSRETEDHWVRARSLRPDAARLLLMLASVANAQNILEIGTSVGYSTVHLALAAQETGGHVTTLELMPAKYEQAAANLARAGLSGFVTQKQGDARALLASLPGPWDLVFVDAEKDVYLDTWQLFKDHVRPGGLVVADNALSHAADLVAMWRPSAPMAATTPSPSPSGRAWNSPTAGVETLAGGDNEP